MILQPIDVLSFFLGIILLNYCSEVLINNGSLLAQKYNVSKMIIGMSLIAFGTSLPELVVSMFASMQGKIDLVTGNIVGSNIANIGLVLGVVGTFYNISCNFKSMKLDVIFLLIATILFSVILYFNQFNDLYAILLILIFGIYIYILIKSNKITDSADNEGKFNLSKLISLILIGSIGLSIGSYCLIEGSISIARYFNIPEMVIGATAIALGTSLPELVASLNAAKKKEFELVIGNIFGSNIINIVLVFSTSLLINENIPKTDDYNFNLGILFLLTILLVLNLIFNKIYRLISLIFLSIYIYYISLIL